jgi:carboxyl-terminal processing protease
MEGNIGYIKLAGYAADVNMSNLYTRDIRRALYELDTTLKLSGWVIDLRENVGGLASMMPLGLAPLFQDSLIGYRVDSGGEHTREYCTNTSYTFGDMNVQFEDLNFSLKNEAQPIAVLISGKTASAGETLASAFTFQSHTRLFGTATKGKATSLQLIEFKSEAKLFLATLNLCDKEKKIIELILPDVECDPDEAYEMAKEWIVNSAMAGIKIE